MMDFSWLNESELKREEEGKLVIFAPAGTDFFCTNGTVSEEGITPESLHNAPYYYTEIESHLYFSQLPKTESIRPAP